ncbi:FecCD family ABC transporter permease [Microbacterium nymphoidis]|uniref:FecCD family ABC transporter permease n=1 Tax=Microbacterium nymphoidis TaxID=2898586 RepID=UPI001E56FB7C|nr:iron ABC transporter permease [Microbacterium nymphoidis]MCD2498488.1 iron ABC transporter permease [Microbacterium nymphoidis]
MTSTLTTEPLRPARHSPRTPLTVAASFALLVAATLVGLFVGGQSTIPAEVLGALTGDAELRIWAIVVEIRLPRTLAAVIAGLGLGLAASLLQTVTRNPVADAGLLGTNAGATVMIAIGMATGLATDFAAQGAWALTGALIATALVSAIGLGGKIYSPTRLILFGVALGAVLTGITTGIMLAAPDAFDGMRNWLSGSMVGVPLESTLLGALMIAAALALALCIARPLEVTLMGDDLARALGTRLFMTRSLTTIAVAIAAGTATALAGPVGFVGLIAAHSAALAANRLGLSAAGRHLTAAAFCGAILLLADLVGRVALWPGELPAGIVAAILGAPFLLWIIRRTRSLT